MRDPWLATGVRVKRLSSTRTVLGRAAVLFLVASAAGGCAPTEAAPSDRARLSIAELQDCGICIVEKAASPLAVASATLEVCAALDLAHMARAEDGYRVPLEVLDAEQHAKRIPAALKLLDPAKIEGGRSEFVLEIPLPFPKI